MPANVTFTEIFITYPELLTFYKDSQKAEILQRKKVSVSADLSCSPREHSMIYNSLILKHGLKNEQQINKQLFSITVLQSFRVY
jgi:hypothetical protein